MAKKAKETASPQNELQRRMAAAGVTGLIRTMDQCPDMRVITTPTGFPRVDRLVNRVVPGIPDGADIEIFSRKKSAGKTTFALQIGAYYQSIGKRVAIIDAERTITDHYLVSLGYSLEDYFCPVRKIQIYAPLIVRSQYEVIPAERLLDCVKFLAYPDGGDCDLVIVDSIAAMDSEKNLNRETIGDQAQYGGISKMLTEFLRMNIAKKATVLWINQAKQKMSSMPGLPPTWETTGGAGIKFFSSVRFELNRTETHKDPKNADISTGFDTRLLIEKNKLGTDTCALTMKYLPGLGFSRVHDWINFAKSVKTIIQSGAWYQIEGGEKFQGENNLFLGLTHNESFLEHLKKITIEREQQMDGVSVSEEVTAEELEQLSKDYVEDRPAAA